jgi:hypothetical protein
MTNSTTSNESAPNSFVKLALGLTLLGSIPNCSPIIVCKRKIFRHN